MVTMQDFICTQKLENISIIKVVTRWQVAATYCGDMLQQQIAVCTGEFLENLCRSNRIQSDLFFGDLLQQ